jgi:hypothetical protein
MIIEIDLIAGAINRKFTISVEAHEILPKILCNINKNEIVGVSEAIEALYEVAGRSAAAFYTKVV